jgi:hypothetical protein
MSCARPGPQRSSETGALEPRRTSDLNPRPTYVGRRTSYTP